MYTKSMGLILLLFLIWAPYLTKDIYKLDSSYSYLIQDPFEELPHPRIRWIDPKKLIPHEHTSKPHLENLIQHLLTLPLTERVPIPVITSTKPRVILDGHHRVAASIYLEIDRIPCWEVDDLDEIRNWENTRIKVYSRVDGSRMTLNQVITSARQGKIDFGIKGTRHVALIGSEKTELTLERVTPRVVWGQWISGGKDYVSGGHPVLYVND